ELIGKEPDNDVRPASGGKPANETDVLRRIGVGPYRTCDEQERDGGSEAREQFPEAGDRRRHVPSRRWRRQIRLLPGRIPEPPSGCPCGTSTNWEFSAFRSGKGTARTAKRRAAASRAGANAAALEIACKSGPAASGGRHHDRGARAKSG